MGLTTTSSLIGGRGNADEAGPSRSELASMVESRDSMLMAVHSRLAEISEEALSTSEESSSADPREALQETGFGVAAIVASLGKALRLPAESVEELSCSWRQEPEIGSLRAPQPSLRRFRRQGRHLYPERSCRPYRAFTELQTMIRRT